jgi:ATP-dependent Clp protease ATP-binding subunit ClpA
MYKSFTERARMVMKCAHQEAQRFNHEYIGTEHILLGLIKEGSGVAANVLRNFDIDLRKIRLEVERLVQSGPDIVSFDNLPKTPRAKKVIEYAMDEARSLGHKYVGTEHILLGLLREQEGVAAQVLMNLGLRLEEVRNEVLAFVGPGEGGQSVPTPPPAAPSYMSLPLADEVRQLLRDAAVVAQWSGHNCVCTGYLLLGLVHASGTSAARALARSNVAPEVVWRELSGECPEADRPGSFHTPPHSRMTDFVLRAAAEEAQARSAFREIEQKVKALREEKEYAVADQDFEKAIRLRDREQDLRRALPEHPWTIGLDHLLIEMLRAPNCEAVRIIEAAGTTPDAVRAALLQEMRGDGPPSP